LFLNDFKLNEMETFFISICFEAQRRGLFPSRHETAVPASEVAEGGVPG
jgi:hypothetical protein